MAAQPKSTQLLALKSYWEDYLNRVIKLSGAGRVQIQECEKVFYAGAFAALNEFSKIGNPGISEESGVNHIQSLDLECKLHVKSIIQKHAEGN